MPDARFRYLVDYLFEVGPTGHGGFGPVPLSHAELLAWQTNMRRMLQPWEITFMRRLSFAYAAESQRAEDADCPAPWSAPVNDDELRAVAKSLRESISGMGD